MKSRSREKSRVRAVVRRSKRYWEKIAAEKTAAEKIAGKKRPRKK